ncbi:MAG: acyl-CoA dehydrogenase family protein [Mycobacteriales bacterium]
MPSSDRTLEEFRAEVRSWAEEHAPPADWMASLKNEEAVIELERSWLRALHEGGYAGAHWSKEWGGGFSLPEQVVLFEEFTRVNAPYVRNWFVALNHTYATLTAAGTEEQKQRHLPAILRADEIWCQGFSEPGAGSDLASLRTTAVRDGDSYVVNGQKIWSSGALHADWCLLLARTDPTAPKRQGISYFLMDMKSPGVEPRVIRQMDGGAHFCEIFLTDVRIPAENLVGAENEGWRLAQVTLSSERGPTTLELAERLRTALGWLIDLAKETHLEGRPAVEDMAVREQLTALHIEVGILGALCHKVVDDLIAKGGTGPEASIVKVYYSELLHRLMDFAVQLQGLAAQEFAVPPLGTAWESGVWMIDFLNSYAWIIGGGTNHIQRSVIGERVLGLPREPAAN